MTNTNVAVKDANSTVQNFLAQVNSDSSLSFYHVEDATQRAALLTALAPLATAANQTAELAALTAIKNAVQTTLPVTGPLTASQLTAASLATSANQSAAIAALTAMQTSLTGTLSVVGPLTSSQLASAGLATTALQNAGNATLTTIATALGTTLQVAGPLTAADLASASLATRALQTTGNTSLASIDTKLSNLTVTVSNPSAGGGGGGDASAANQTTGNASLASIVTNTSGLPTTKGILTAANSLSFTPASDASFKEDSTQRATLLAAFSPLATAANQATEITNLTAIKTALTGTLAVSGPLTSAQLTSAALATAAAQATGNTSLGTIATTIAGTLKTSTVDAAGTARQTGAQNVVGTLSATGPSTALLVRGDFNMTLYGTFTATVVIERSFDGTNWFALTALGTAFSFTAPCTEVFGEPEAGVRYRFNCTSYTSGAINYRISQ